MEWWHILLALMFLAQVLLCVFNYLTVSGLAQIIQSQKQLNESQQALSDQMSDLEEQIQDTKTEIFKCSKYFINFAKGTKTGKQWYDGI